MRIDPIATCMENLGSCDGQVWKRAGNRTTVNTDPGSRISDFCVRYRADPDLSRFCSHEDAAPIASGRMSAVGGEDRRAGGTVRGDVETVFRTGEHGRARAASGRDKASAAKSDWTAQGLDHVAGCNRELRTVKRHAVVEEIAERMRTNIVGWRNPLQIAGDRPVQSDRVQPIAAAHVAPDVADQVRRHSFQLDRGVLIRAATRATTTDVVVAQDERIRIVESDTECCRAFDAVVGDPNGLVLQSLTE